MKKILDKLFDIQKKIKNICKLLEQKLLLRLLKIKCYIRTKYYLSIDTKKTAIIYFITIILGLFVAFNLKIDYKINSNSLKEYFELYRNTGIALIGLSGIIFTLQIFSQESQNNYMNSVMEKIIDIKAQHIVEYIYLCITTFIFLILPKIHIDPVISINYYYISLITIFILMGIDLFSTTRNSNKYRLLKKIEKRVNRIVELVEKENKDFDRYCTKYNQKSLTLVQSLNRMNGLFVSQIQCINIILRNSIDDPLLFANGMDVYTSIIKVRLEKRKNTFNRINIPFINEVLPHEDNDSFIEKYMIEYLDEYAKFALNNRNRDILAIIQNTYHKILLLGKDNRYKNSDDLELTVKVIFTYYLDLIKDIVMLNSDNMLFDTVEIFKDIFIKNSSAFRNLIDQDLYNKLENISDLSLDNNSLMNFRNVQSLITVTLYPVLNSENTLKSIDLKNVFKTLKHNCIKFNLCNTNVRRYDGGRLYLNYIFYSFEPYSVMKYLEDYYNSNVAENEFISDERFDNDEMTNFVDFFTDDTIITIISNLRDKGIYVTGINDLKYSLAMIIQLIIKLLNDKKYKHIESKLKSNLFTCFNAIIKIFSLEESYGMSYYELNDFFNDILYSSIVGVLANNDEIKELYIKDYVYCIKTVYKGTAKGRLKIDYLYEIINYLYSENRITEINEILDWYLNTFDNKLFSVYATLKDVSRDFISERNITYENRIELKKEILIKYEEILKESTDDELELFIINNNIKLKSKTRKAKIKELLKNSLVIF